MFHIAHFENTYFSMTLQYEIFGDDTVESAELSKEKIKQVSQEQQFDLFFLKKERISEIYEKKYIYGTDGAISKLKDKGIKEGIYHSIFIGDVEVIYKNLDSVENIYENNIFYHFGTAEQAIKFKSISEQDIDSKYSVIDFNEKSGSEKGLYATLALIWGSVYGITLIISLFNSVLSRQELFVQYILGGDPACIFLKSVTIDTMVFSLIYFFTIGVFKKILPIECKVLFQLLSFCAMLSVNVIIQGLIMYKTSSEMRGLGKREKRIIHRILMVVKTTVIVVSVILLSANCVLINECILYLNQHEFYANNDHHFYKIDIPSNSNDEMVILSNRKAIEEFWIEFDTVFNEEAIRLYDASETFGEKAVLGDLYSVRLMFPYMSKNVIEVVENCTEEKIYVVIPAGTKSDTANVICNNIGMICCGKNSEGVCVEVMEYDGNAEIISVKGDADLYKSTFVEDPIIIIDNLSQPFAQRCMNKLGFCQNTMYRTNDEKLSLLLGKYSFSFDENVVETSAEELFLYYASSFQKICKLVSGISVLMILLDITIIILLVWVEYSLRGKEIILKKILGYSIYQQNEKLLQISVLVSVMAVLLSSLLITLLDYGSIYFAIVCGLLVMMLEIVTMLGMCVHMNKLQIIPVLKGAKG